MGAAKKLATPIFWKMKDQLRLCLISGLIAITQLGDGEDVASAWGGDGQSTENAGTAKNTIGTAPGGHIGNEWVVAEELGPELSPAGECAREGCDGQPTGSADSSRWKGKLAKDENKSGPSESKAKSQTPLNKEIGDEGPEGTSELTEVPESKPFLSFISDMVSNGIQTAKDQIYGQSAKVTSDFADKVRNAVHDELNGFLWSVFTNVGNAVSSPGKLLLPQFLTAQ